MSLLPHFSFSGESLYLWMLRNSSRVFLTRAGWKCVNFTFCSRILIATKYKVVYSVPVSSFIEREILQQTGKLDSFQRFLHEFKYFCGNIKIFFPTSLPRLKCWVLSKYLQDCAWSIKLAPPLIKRILKLKFPTNSAAAAHLPHFNIKEERIRKCAASKSKISLFCNLKLKSLDCTAITKLFCKLGAAAAACWIVRMT